MIKVKVNGNVYEYPRGTTPLQIAKDLNIKTYVANVNNTLRELTYQLYDDATIEFFDLDNYDAARVYETSLRFLILMAINELYPQARVTFKQSVSRSISCHIEGIDRKVDAQFLTELDNKMQEIIKKDLPITRKKISIEEAYKLYEEKGYYDKVEVLKYREEDTVNVYTVNGYTNYMFGYMVPSTGYLTKYQLLLYHPDFVVQYPRAEEKGDIPPFEDSTSFGRMLKESQQWARLIECDRIPLLNKYIESNRVMDLVNMCESKHNNMLSELGQIIKDNIDNIKIIAIAGPSSSGKTTFSHRLRIELLSRGIKPVKISIDDYYLDRNQAPKDEYGNPDLEHIEALDLELFNQHLLALIQGEEVQLPHFDFKIGKRVPGEKIRIDEHSPIIIEGIHALNHRLTSSIPKYQKFKIYISPLWQINIDNHNPINATDIRMLRRMVRDYKYRNTPPQKTIGMWSSVRKGEFRWIYPFQEEADYIFNSELTYELGVLKKYALPALEKVTRDDPYFITANRLVKFLKYIKDIDDRYVPANSLLREFIGDSSFYLEQKETKIDE
ncbi:MAG TPA: nucleoside kinase [Bacilli bacterium]|nr:nucleoside kinase [Bacilli bacterium]